MAPLLFAGYLPSKLRILQGLGGFPLPEADQVQDRVQTQGRDRVTGGFLHQRFGPERDPEARLAQHGQVVGTIPDGDHLLPGNVLFLGNLQQ